MTPAPPRRLVRLQHSGVHVPGEVECACERPMVCWVEADEVEGVAGQEGAYEVWEIWVVVVPTAVLVRDVG